jgi:PIN domain nuclease of toxin-antitoxin system
MSGLLLDTHVWLWYAEGLAGHISGAALEAVEEARRRRALHVSSISVWEIGMLHAKGRIALALPVREWVRRTLELPGLRIYGLDQDIALESTLLPDEPHGDPADRFLIATARSHDLVLVTADERIIKYGRQGHVHVMALRSG